MVSELNRLWDFVYRFTLAPGQPGWTETPSGLIPPPDRKGGAYVPPFAQLLTEGDTPTLGIHPGYIYIPKDDSSSTNHEVQDYALYPYMPTLNSIALDNATPPTVGLSKSDTTLIYMEFTLAEITNEVGNTASSGTQAGNVGLTVQMSAASAGTGHNHDDSIAVAEMISYKYSVTPSFVYDDTITVFPKSTAEIIRIPWGKITLDADGMATTNEWYCVGTQWFNPQNYLRDPTGGSNPAVAP